MPRHEDEKSVPSASQDLWADAGSRISDPEYFGQMLRRIQRWAMDVTMFDNADDDASIERSDAQKLLDTVENMSWPQRERLAWLVQTHPTRSSFLWLPGRDGSFVAPLYPGMHEGDR
jgi:hypothetical protein